MVFRGPLLNRQKKQGKHRGSRFSSSLFQANLLLEVFCSSKNYSQGFFGSPNGGAKKTGENKRFLVLWRFVADFVPFVFDVPFFFAIWSFILDFLLSVFCLSSFWCLCLIVVSIFIWKVAVIYPRDMRNWNLAEKMLQFVMNLAFGGACGPKNWKPKKAFLSCRVLMCLGGSCVLNFFIWPR